MSSRQEEHSKKPRAPVRGFFIFCVWFSRTHKHSPLPPRARPLQSISLLRDSIRICTAMAEIGEYSVATVPIQMFFDLTALGFGTAFVWSSNKNYFLITNWHNLSGRDLFTGKHLSEKAAEPNRIEWWFHLRGKLGEKTKKSIAIRAEGKPLWRVHPQKGTKVDIAALPLTDMVDVQMYPINLMSSAPLRLQVGMDVFVLGYPFGIGQSGLPVWKRGSIASEPLVLGSEHPIVFVDTASRPGMSGSPIVQRSWGSHMMEDGSLNLVPGVASRFVGIYTGRLAGSDPIDAQLGLMWPAFLVEEVVRGNKIDV
jgi:hypothetical protein